MRGENVGKMRGWEVSGWEVGDVRGWEVRKGRKLKGK